jgi:hypothetical protein
MFSSSSILNILFIFVVTVSIAYIFGIVLVRTMDERLSKIKIEPSQEFFENKNKKPVSEVIVYHKYEMKEENDGNVKIEDISSKIPKNYKFDKEYYEQMNQYNQIEGFTSQPSSKEIDWTPADKQYHICYKNHIHKKDGKDSNCRYGVTNYADPKDMSPVDAKIYMMNYPPNFTLQDYINWLWCFQDRKDQLTYNHLRNLEKLEMGKELKEEQGVCPPPAYYHPPMNAENYFEKMYDNMNEFQIAESLNSTTGPMLGYNYNNYSEFTQNRDVYGMDGEIRNPDIGHKRTAREVDDYIIPHDSQNLEIEKAYKPYHVKKVEI